MAGMVFLVQWNAAEAEELARPPRSQGWAVEVESQDGAKAGKLIRETLPYAVVIYLTRLPSHGRETADGHHGAVEQRSLYNGLIPAKGNKP